MPVDTPPLLATERSALLDLLDDPSPVVRQGLKHRFADLGDAGHELLRETAHGPNRHLAWFARQYLAELDLDDPAGEFRDYIRDLNHDLETGLIMLARVMRPALDTAAISAQLDKLAQRSRELVVEPASTRSKCRAINRVLFHEFGLRGNAEHYTDPDNSFIDQVLARRCGIPLSLCAVYLLVARRLGLPLEPIGLPGHFMLGCVTEDPPFFIDAFDGGVFRPPEEIFAFLWTHELPPQLSTLAPTPVHEVLCRNCRNLAAHYEAHGDQKHAQLFDGFVNTFAALSASTNKS